MLTLDYILKLFQQNSSWNVKKKNNKLIVTGQVQTFEVENRHVFEVAFISLFVIYLVRLSVAQPV